MWLVSFMTLAVCSHAAVIPKIIGGSNTTIDQVPWAVILNIEGVIHCGGSIISKNHILTSASCIPRNGPKDFVVRSGSTFLSEGGTNSQVDNITVHPGFNQIDFDYDVAVMKLKTPLNITDLQKPISLSLKSAEADSKARIAGWGTGLPGGNFAQVLQSVEVPVIDHQACFEDYAIYRNVTERMICAGEIGKDACTADAGIALTIKNVQYGIVSWGNGCGQPGYPGVYSDVSALKQFIDTYSNNEAKWV